MDPVASPAITVSIEELEIEGLSPVGRFELARGLQQELSRLFLEGGVPAGLLAGDGGRPPMVGGAVGAADLGRAVARALYEGWR
jgi:hypothetical protein